MAARIAVVFGTRPEAIKLAPVILAFRTRQEVDCRVWATAQHREMLDQVLTVFQVRTDVDLDLMLPAQSLSSFTARCIDELDRCILRERPDLILAQGDTTTVLCAALTAFYHKVPLAHLEAGLRTGDLMAPWPEEANRVLVSRLASVHFAPTETARQNLIREGVAPSAITLTGNTVVDALLIALEMTQSHPPRIPGLPDSLQPTVSGACVPRMVLVTGHRRESFGDGFENICRAIKELATRFPDVHFVYPVHLNPNVRDPVQRILGTPFTAMSESSQSRPPEEATRADAHANHNIHLLEPLPYLPFVWLMKRCTLLLTDSGGVQEEAPSLGKPVLVMRDATERPEAVDAGSARLVGNDATQIVREVASLLSDSAAYAAMVRGSNPYGDGHAADRVVSGCLRYLADI
jgi:UDP-N-acetylglucosamine 2-epimerase (non-hydrolysing)